MLPSVLLLLLIISGAQASFYGVVYTLSFEELQSGGYPVIYDYKVSFNSCQEVDSFLCGASCVGDPVYSIDESKGEWCQKGRSSHFVYQHPTTATSMFDPVTWTENINGFGSSTIFMYTDMRNRSDSNKLNSSPQTTTIPLLRVPSNCQRNISLLISDPDGDDSRCRYTSRSVSVLGVSTSCVLSFSPTSSSAEGPYAVLLTMEDFPRQNVTLTDSNGVQEVKTPSDAISRLPLNFVFRVDPAALSCTEGEYLPRFLPPTPEHGAQFYTNVNQAVEIRVRAEATQAEITELLFSGPAGLVKNSSGSGNFTLTWTPTGANGGLNKTLCFVVQANSSGSVYQSDLRCVFVTAGESPPTVSPPTTTPPTTTTLTPMTNQPTTTTTTPPTTTTLTPTTNQPTTTTEPPTSSITNSTPDPGPYYVLALNAKISTSLSLETDSATIINLIKEELKRQGLPSDIIVKLLSSGAVRATTPAP